MKPNKIQIYSLHSPSKLCTATSVQRLAEMSINTKFSASDPKSHRDKRMAETEESRETGESRVATMLTVRGSGAGSGASILRQDHFV